LPEDQQIRAEASQDVSNVYGHGHADYLADYLVDVVRSLLSGQPGKGAEGRTNVEILSALYGAAADDDPRQRALDLRADPVGQRCRQESRSRRR